MVRRALLILAVSVVSVAASFAQDANAGPDVDRLVEEGIALLLERQEGEGGSEWPYEGVYRVGGAIPLGYRVGGTAIVGLALIGSPGLDDDEDRREAVVRAVAFILDALKDERMGPGFSRGYDVRGWGHTYALTFFLRLQALDRVPAAHAKGVAAAVRSLIRIVEDSEIPDVGGWNYARGRGADASVFMTAPTLQALFMARAAGHRIDSRVVDRALDAIERARMDSGSYAYNPRRRDLEGLSDEDAPFMDKLPGAVGRMVVAEATLMLAGRGDAERLAAAVAAFFRHQRQLELRRKRDGTHLRPYGVAPYYYMYGHYYVAQAIELLDDARLRGKYRDELGRVLLAIREDDGGFNDRVFERSKAYGTALAVMALQMPRLDKTPAWRAPRRKWKL